MAGDVAMGHTAIALGDERDDLPASPVWRAQLLDAAILAASVTARATLPVHPAARMALLAEARRCGLTGQPPSVDVLGRFDNWMRLIADPRISRRLLARHMNQFVGTPWAGTVVRIAEAVAVASNRGKGQGLDSAQVTALRGLRVSLGLCWPNECAPAG